MTGNGAARVGTGTNTKVADAPQTMSTYAFVGRVFWRFKGLFVVYTLLSTLAWAIQLSTPFLSRAFINTLTGDAPATVGIHGLAVLWLMAELGRVTAEIVRALMTAYSQIPALALMRANLLEHILQRPGASALPLVPGKDGGPSRPLTSGEAMVQFQEDLNQSLIFLENRLRAIGQVMYATVALVTMVRVSATITAVMLLPLGLVFVVAHVTGGRSHGCGRRLWRHRSG